jgi:hypothetical protein
MADIKLEELANAIYESASAKWRIGSNFVPIERGTKLIRIDEATLHRVFDRHKDTGYIVISANRSERPDLKTGKVERTREDNIAAYRKLHAMVKSSPFGYLPLWGGFKEAGKDAVDPEPSFMVFPKKHFDELDDGNSNFDDLMKFGMDAMTEFGQDAIMVCFPIDYYDKERAGKTTWVDKDNIVTATFGKDPVWNDRGQEFWSQDRRKGAGGYAQFARWLKGQSPWERGASSTRDNFHPTNMKIRDVPDPPERFSSQMEAYEFFIEPEAATYSRKMIRSMTGYDTGIYKYLFG